MAITFGFHSCQTAESTEPVPDVTDPAAEAIAGIPMTTPEARHEVMVLGSFHFNRSGDGSDVVAKNQLDISTPESQRQIEAITEEIANQFQPTIIAVEWMPRHQATFDSLYQEYREGNWEMTKNEAFQLGFRIAQKAQLPGIHCIDNRPPQPETVNEIDDWDEYARQQGQEALWHAFDEDNNRFNTYVDSMLSVLDLRNYLRMMNSETFKKRYKQLSLTGLVNLGVGDNYIGADLTGNWYRRNTRLFVNVRNLCQLPQERILIIYGAGHKWVLDELFEDAPEFTVRQWNDLTGD